MFSLAGRRGGACLEGSEEGVLAAGPGGVDGGAMLVAVLRLQGVAEAVLVGVEDELLRLG